MSLVSLVLISTSLGTTSENAGTSKTSSNVSPSMKFLEEECMGFVAMGKDKEEKNIERVNRKPCVYHKEVKSYSLIFI